MFVPPELRGFFASASLAPMPVQSAPVRSELLSLFPLRDYQLRVIQQAAMLMRLGYRRILIQMPTGAGKTVLAAALLYGVSQLGFTSQFIVHRDELIKQTSKSFTGFDLDHGFITSKRAFDPDPALHLASVQTLVNRLAALLPPDVMVVDECFVAGTLVDGKPIELIEVGDVVTAYDDKSMRFYKRAVTRTFKKQYFGDLVEIQLGENAQITCTRDHPFLTMRGWINADQLKESDYVLRYTSSMSHVRCSIGPDQKTPSRYAAQNGEIVLQSGLRSRLSIEGVIRDHAFDEPQRRIRANATQQPDAQGRSAGEHASNTDSDRTQTCNSRGQRATGHSSRNETAVDVRAGRVQFTSRGSGRLGEDHRMADALQDRLREPRAENRDRSGWELPRQPESPGSGQEERYLPHWERVGGVTIQQSADSGSSGRGEIDRFVYNLEVEGLHTYTANGIVVHNCHHATAASWERVLANCSGFIIGLTATPERLDGRGLAEHFDVMIKGPTPAELMRRGFLSEFDYYGFPPPDTTDLGDVAGDFNRGGATALMDRPKLIGDTVEHYLNLAAGQRGIVFAGSREHSRKLAEAFRGNGVPALHIDGDMDGERDDAMESFEDGQTHILTNVDLLGEGLHTPGVTYVGLCRITKSRSLHKQQCGRPLAMFEGRTHRAVFCDHAGNGMRLQDLPDTDVDWTLQGRIKSKRNNATLDPGESIRQCLGCFMISYSSVTVCPRCGTEFPRQKRAAVEQAEGKLTKVDKEMLRKQAALRRKAEEKQCRTYGEFKALAEARGYSSPHNWARMKMTFKSSYKGWSR